MIHPQSSQSTQQLITYRPQQQHAGMFISGFDWRLYGTGTFRQMPRDDHEAEIYLNRFVPVSYTHLTLRSPGTGLSGHT